MGVPIIWLGRAQRCRAWTSLSVALFNRAFHDGSMDSRHSQVSVERQVHDGWDRGGFCEKDYWT